MIRRPGHDDAEALQRALVSRTPARGEVRELVRTAEALCEAATIQPSAAFRTSLREQLMAEAATALVPVEAPAKAATATVVAPAASRGRRRLVGLATAAVVSVGGIGLVSSSASAVPGDALYGVKRGVENVELVLHRDDAARGAYQLERARTRLAEADALLDAPAPQRAGVVDVLEDFTEQAEDGSTALLATYAEGESTAPVEQVDGFTADAARRLGAMSEAVPADATASFEAAATAVSELATEAARLCDTCATTDLGSLVGAVTGAARTPGSSAERAEAGPSRSEDPARKPAAKTSAAPAPAATAPAVGSKPAPAKPRPSATTPGLVTGVTKPLVGALLGDDEQVGLVPGLLNGLLGGGSK